MMTEIKEKKKQGKTRAHTQVKKSPQDKKVHLIVGEIFKFLRTTKFFTGQ
jgi:hypothetical protein